MIPSVAFLGEGEMYLRGEPILPQEWLERDTQRGEEMSGVYHRLLRLGSSSVWLVTRKLAQLALHNPHIWANSLKPVCFLCFLLFWCPLLPFIETGTLKIYTKMVLYMKNEFLTSNTPSMGFEPTLYQP